MPNFRKLFVTTLAAIGLAASGVALRADESLSSMRPIGASEEWRGVNGDSHESGFSQLAQIDAKTVGRLRLAWSMDLPGEATLEASPVAVDGMLYFTGSKAGVYALDAVTGALKWKYDPKTWEAFPAKMAFAFAANRGVAYDNGKIFVGALDGRLIALDAKTGAVMWSVETTERRSVQTITGAPRVFAGKVIIGQAGADIGARGYVTAYDQATGKQAWRFYVVPASPQANAGDPAMEAAAKTWNGEFWKDTGGGGAPWDSMTFDAELGRIYVGTANAAPYDPEQRSPGGGDNLYTASIVALDANTGKYLWHYQVNPRDSWDYDCTQQMTLATLMIDGRPRKVLMQAPKNGFFYVLDRESGKLISAGNIAKENWADHIDVASGRPVENPDIRYEKGMAVIYPFSSGAHSFMRMAYSPGTGLVYVPTMQMGTRFHKGAPDDDDVNVGGLNIGDSPIAPGDATGALVAWDPIKQAARWTVKQPHLWNGGALATAGNLVFQGTADGWFMGLDARSGKPLWKSYAGMGIIASPMTYSVNGRQYVSILAGYGGSAAMQSPIMNRGWKYAHTRRILTYALDGKAKVPAFERPSFVIHPLDNPTEVLDPKTVALGKALSLACAACHGRNLVSAGGPAPDLRESAIPLDPAAFRSVVHDGALMERGMPRFGTFTTKQIEGVRQYIRSRARAALASKNR